MIICGEKTDYSKKRKCIYSTIDCSLDGMQIRPFFVRRTKHVEWSGLITTDRILEFLKAYDIYSMRWNIEVFNKESKQCLGLGDCQSINFCAQIAYTAIWAIQYNPFIRLSFIMLIVSALGCCDL